jgi:hypothetical protein
MGVGMFMMTDWGEAFRDGNAPEGSLWEVHGPLLLNKRVELHHNVVRANPHSKVERCLFPSTPRVHRSHLPCSADFAPRNHTTKARGR